MSKHYGHHNHYSKLHIPDHWEHYWSKYPNGYTLLEALISWTSQVNDMIVSYNHMSDDMVALDRNFRALEKELRASWDGYKDHTEKTYTDFREEILTIVNNWIATIEPTIQDTVVSSLSSWLDDGTLADIINNDVFDMKANSVDLEKTNNVIDVYISPANFPSLDDAISYARDNGKVIKADTIDMKKHHDFRGVGLEIDEIITNGFMVILGAYNVANPNKPAVAGRHYRPPQTIGNIIGTDNHQNEVIIRGACYQVITVQSYNGFIQLRMNDQEGTGDYAGTYPSTFNAYSTFNFLNVKGVEIKNDPGSGTTGKTLWTNENEFNLGNTAYFSLGDLGGYKHNLNVINRGCFEGNNGQIIIKSGTSNIFKDIRAEGKLTVTTEVGSRMNTFEFRHWLYRPTIVDRGFGNKFITPSEQNLRLVSQDKLTSYHITSGTAGSGIDIQFPFRNLVYLDSPDRCYGMDGAEGRGTVIYESGFIRDAKNLRVLLESNLKSGFGFGIGYKYYDANYNDITSQLSGEGFTAFVVSTVASALTSNDSEGAYRGPSTGLNGYSNTGSTKSDIVSLMPSGHWNAKSDIGNQIKYVKFFVTNAGDGVEGDVLKFYDLTISIYDIGANYRAKYYSNGIIG